MSKREVDQLYWLLVTVGPLTMQDILARLDWTRLETQSRLHYLKTLGCVRLIERGQHRGHLNPCGKWQAITESEIIEAIEVSA